MLVLHYFNRLNKVLLFNSIFSSKTLNKIMKTLFQSNWGFELSWIFWFSSFLTVKQQKMKTLKFALFRQNFLLCCFASAGNRNRVYRVGGDNSTTEPPMLDLNCSNRSSKVLLYHPSFSWKRWIKIMKTLFHFNWFPIQLIIWVVFLFFDCGTKKNEKT